MGATSDTIPSAVSTPRSGMDLAKFALQARDVPGWYHNADQTGSETKFLDAASLHGTSVLYLDSWEQGNDFIEDDFAWYAGVGQAHSAVQSMLYTRPTAIQIGASISDCQSEVIGNEALLCTVIFPSFTWYDVTFRRGELAVEVSAPTSAEALRLAMILNQRLVSGGY